MLLAEFVLVVEAAAFILLSSAILVSESMMLINESVCSALKVV